MDNQKTVRILIVEDERIVALDIEAALRAKGHEVVGICDTGEDAVKVVESEQPNLVLMDIHLKGQMTGIETAEVMYRRFRIPIVYVTAHSDEATLEQMRQTKYCGYLVKPFDRRELNAEIELGLYKWQIERRLEACAQLNRRLFEECASPLVVMNEFGRVLKVNRLAESLFGYSAEKLVGRDFVDCFVTTQSRDSQRKLLMNKLNEWAGKSFGGKLQMPGVNSTGRSLSMDLEIMANANETDFDYFVLIASKLADTQAR